MKGMAGPAALAACCVLAFASCGRDRADVVRVAPQGDTRVDLAPVDLSGHAGFDQLDRFVQSTGATADVMQVYEDLSRLAPDNRLVLLRAAHAALVLDASDAGLRVASGILAKLAPPPDAPADPDVQFVDLILATRALARASSGDTLDVGEATAPMARQVLERTGTLGAATGWVGPHGATAADANRMLDAIRQALATHEASQGAPQDAAAAPAPAETASPAPGGAATP